MGGDAIVQRRVAFLQKWRMSRFLWDSWNNG